MKETPAPSGPGPHARFPWVQLVFCIACFTMTAWTWLRYSYAWRVPTQYMSHEAATGWLRQRYVSFDGVVTGPWQHGRYRGLHVTGTRIGPPTRIMVHRSDSAPAWSPEKGRLQHFLGRIWPPESYRPSNEFGGIGGFRCDTVVDTTASRFHPASVAGLVVGAMGVFVFALYLRRWLTERRADHTR